MPDLNKLTLLKTCSRDAPTIRCMQHFSSGAQVVAFQAMMDMMAKEFPGAFAGYNLQVTESHQRTKADTSGTAKAVVGSLQKLGLEFSEVSQLPGNNLCFTVNISWHPH